jgi:glycogen operon protein
VIDTALPAPNDFSDLETAVKIEQNCYLVTARSSVVLMEKVRI